MSDETNPQRDDMGALRAILFETVRAVKASTIDLDRARMVNELSKTLVDTGRLDVDYLRVTQGERSDFLAPAADKAPGLPPGITGVTVHRLKG